MTNLSFEHSQAQWWEISHFVDFFVKLPKNMVWLAGKSGQCHFFDEKVVKFGFDFSSLCLYIDGSACQLLQNSHCKTKTNSNSFLKTSLFSRKEFQKWFHLDQKCEAFNLWVRKVNFAELRYVELAKSPHVGAKSKLSSTSL